MLIHLTALPARISGLYGRVHGGANFGLGPCRAVPRSHIRTSDPPIHPALSATQALCRTSVVARPGLLDAFDDRVIALKAWKITQPTGHGSKLWMGASLYLSGLCSNSALSMLMPSSSPTVCAETADDQGSDPRCHARERPNADHAGDRSHGGRLLGWPLSKQSIRRYLAGAVRSNEVERAAKDLYRLSGHVKR
jgi:hypothetical protein